MDVIIWFFLYSMINLVEIIILLYIYIYKDKHNLRNSLIY